jgi:ribose/xylose/arabinose/galactoside ABC-type transport system permease subunit
MARWLCCGVGNMDRAGIQEDCMRTERSGQETALTTMAKPKRTRSENLVLIRKVWPWVFFVVMVSSFTIVSRSLNDVNFLSPRSIQGILVYATQILLVALGETLIIIAAGIDLSSGYVLGLSAVVAAEIMKALYAAGVAPVLTVIAGMVGGILICIIPGWINGALVARVKVPPFISTLGLGYGVYGVALLISGGYPVANQPPYLGQIGNGYLLYYWPDHGFSFFKVPAMATPADLASIVPLVPNVVLMSLIVTVVCWFVLAKTQFGQHLYAIGGNFEAAVRAGIPVQRTLTLVYIVAAVLAGVAGSLWAARFTSGAANAGETTTLMAIAAVVIGGASLFGGEGTVVGTVVGSLIIATIQFGLVILGVLPFWQYVAVGLVVIVAVIVDQFGRALK